MWNTYNHITCSFLCAVFFFLRYGLHTLDPRFIPLSIFLIENVSINRVNRRVIRVIRVLSPAFSGSVSAFCHHTVTLQ